MDICYALISVAFLVSDKIAYFFNNEAINSIIGNVLSVYGTRKLEQRDTRTKHKILGIEFVLDYQV